MAECCFTIDQAELLLIDDWREARIPWQDSMEDKSDVKRRKIDSEASNAKPADAKPITSANQLRSLLFSQQPLFNVKQGADGYRDLSLEGLTCGISLTL